MALSQAKDQVNILCLDGGSSSLKFAFYDASEHGERLLLRDAFAAASYSSPSTDSTVLLDRIFASIAATGAEEPSAIGHRIVFGGPDHVTPALVTPELLIDLERFVPFDPLHLRSQLDLVGAVRSRVPKTPQVVCFDSAFHARMPAVAQRIPLPRSVGPLIRRYGYHGISFEYIVSVLGDRAGGRLLIAHLGSGASLAAVRDGRPLDTTMGFSPLGGLMMGTRPGDLDPGVMLYLATAGYTASELSALLNKQSGLLGVSEVSSSMETLLSRAADEPRAMEAIELFVYQTRKHAGAMIAVLGGLDTLVFTGGIGEHAAKIRRLIAEGLTHVGIRLDQEKNAADADVISQSDSTVIVRVIPTDESLVIARHVMSLLRQK
jgi:acetate kinase